MRVEMLTFVNLFSYIEASSTVRVTARFTLKSNLVIFERIEVHALHKAVFAHSKERIQTGCK